jgi:hypothetical protein
MRLAEEVARRVEELARTTEAAEVMVDRDSPDNELVVRVRPRVPADDKASLDIAVGSEDTVVMTFGRFGLAELVDADPSALADEVEELARAIMAGGLRERLSMVGGRPASSRAEVQLRDRTCTFHHAKFRFGRREHLAFQYVAY